MLDNRRYRDVLVQPAMPVVDQYDWRWMLRALFDRPHYVYLAALLCAGLAIAYVALRPAHYTASAVLNITNLRLTTSGEDAFFTESQFDPTFLETQIQIIGSTPVLADVIETLKLSDGGDPASPEALKRLRQGLAIQRLGQSNLVEIGFNSLSASHSAVVANDVARAYIAKQERDRLEAVQSASGWLRERLREAGPKAQVISAATPPTDKSDMRGMLIIAGAGIVGGGTGLVLAFLVAFLDRSIRSQQRLEAVTDIECFGSVPFISPRDAKAKAGTPAIFAAADLDSASAPAQALRLACVSLLPPTAASRMQAAGITSPDAGDGKTTIASSLAYYAAAMGRSVLLVDAQIYRPALSKVLAPGKAGLKQFLEAEETDLTALVVRDARTGLDFLPLGKVDGAGQTMLWSTGMERLLQLAATYDLVLFDLPPLDATGDIRAATRYLDSLVLVVEAGRTREDAISTALTPVIREKLVGSILNRAESRKGIIWRPGFLRRRKA